MAVVYGLFSFSFHFGIIFGVHNFALLFILTVWNFICWNCVQFGWFTLTKSKIPLANWTIKETGPFDKANTILSYVTIFRISVHSTYKSSICHLDPIEKKRERKINVFHPLEVFFMFICNFLFLFISFQRNLHNISWMGSWH